MKLEIILTKFLLTNNRSTQLVVHRPGRWIQTYLKFINSDKASNFEKNIPLRFDVHLLT